MSRKDNELAIEDIGPPSDFRHLTHVGWDPIAGFNLDKIADDSQLKQFLDRAGVKKQEPQTSTDLITQNEGLQESPSSPPVVPTRSAPPSMESKKRRAPPPPHPPPPCESVSCKDSNQKLTKEDIGHPQDFRHLKHIDWHPDRSFGMDDAADPQLEKAGVEESQLQDPLTQNEGHQAVKEEADPGTSDSSPLVDLPSSPTLEELEAKQSGTPPPTYDDCVLAITPPPQRQQMVLPPVPAPRRSIIGGGMSMEQPPTPSPRKINYNPSS